MQLEAGSSAIYRRSTPFPTLVSERTPDESGNYSKPDESGNYSKPDESGNYSKPDESGNYSKSVGLW